MRYSIEGGSLPVVILQLSAGEKLISEAGGRTWSRGPVVTETTSGGGIGKSIGRLFSGESLFLSTYTAEGNAEIAFASSFPGRIIARELKAGESIICQKKAFLAASYGTELSAYVNTSIKKGLFGGEGFIMQRVTGPGLAFFEVDGYSVEYDLAPGEELTCDTGVLALMDESCTMDVRMVKGLKNVFFGGEGLVDTVVIGPGRVCVQSMTIANIAKLIIPYIPDKN